MYNHHIPSWGNILSEGRNIVLNGAWWATTFAGVMILLTVLALNILAEGLTDALVNPRLKGGKKPEANQMNVFLPMYKKHLLKVLH